MSADGSKADIEVRLPNVRFTPKTGHQALVAIFEFDHGSAAQ